MTPARLSFPLLASPLPCSALLPLARFVLRHHPQLSLRSLGGEMGGRLSARLAGGQDANSVGLHSRRRILQVRAVEEDGVRGGGRRAFLLLLTD
eukprot:768518-Hanusia_phi.AAC.2